MYNCVFVTKIYDFACFLSVLIYHYNTYKQLALYRVEPLFVKNSKRSSHSNRFLKYIMESTLKLE